MNPNEILDKLEILFPEAKCELNYQTPFQLLVAVVLSAQTTDQSVNKVTVKLFEKYENCYLLAKADVKDVENIIKNIGLYRNKAKSIIALSKDLVTRYQGNVPHTYEDLMSLAGVGRKTANVVRSVIFDIPSIAVDTHVERVAKRLKLVYQNDDVLKVEKKLMRKFPQSRWNRAHHLLIFFGRYLCKAKNPQCEDCCFQEICRVYKKNKKSTNNED